MARAPTANAHWRDSARVARFFFIDANAAFPLLFFLLHIKLWTFVIAAFFMIFFTMLNRFGFSLNVFGRVLKGFLAGPRKMSIPWWSN